ncbi:DUF4440 domain-containing protein [Arsukibacterium perlucidum]|uniref:DUF4440 domain-containing protein n=1 Tax=Arsukibacterium perlucidum TaxID=368811 RepID=UPI0003658CF7|nr:DUF4440 domain-containing protein [Arsukibacterium perlucidum]
MKNINLIVLTVILVGCAQKEEKTATMLTSSIQEQLQITAEDRLAIKNIIDIQSKSGNFEEREKIWSEDARWLQAFGRVFHGKDTITSFEKRLHSNAGYAASFISVRRDPEIKFLRPDVVVVHQYHEREGQVINEVVAPTRRINTTYIITKENGTWLLRDKV